MTSAVGKIMAHYPCFLKKGQEGCYSKYFRGSGGNHSRHLCGSRCKSGGLRKGTQQFFLPRVCQLLKAPFNKNMHMYVSVSMYICIYVYMYICICRCGHIGLHGAGNVSTDN